MSEPVERRSVADAVQALLVVDMHQAPLSDPTKHDREGVIDRIDRLALRFRQRGDVVVFVLHEGKPGSEIEPDSPGWQPHEGLSRSPLDRVVRKRGNDAFAGTELAETLHALGAQQVVVCGWATDFCVDSTVRGAVDRGFEVTVASDCHTLNDRPHLEAPAVIEHHNWVWAHLVARPEVRVLREAEL